LTMIPATRRTAERQTTAPPTAAKTVPVAVLIRGSDTASRQSGHSSKKASAPIRREEARTCATSRALSLRREKRRVTIQVDGERREVSAQEAMLLSLIHKGVNGDIRASGQFFKMV
jgi:hypothetical protein